MKNMTNAQISFKNSNSYRQENKLTTNNGSLSSLAKINEKCDFNTNFILTKVFTFGRRKLLFINKKLRRKNY